MKKKSLKPEGKMLRGVVDRLIESLASMRHSSKLICAISVCNTLTVGVHLSSTPSISGPGSATVACNVSFCVFVTFPYCISGKVWYLIVSIHGL